MSARNTYPSARTVVPTAAEPMRFPNRFTWLGSTCGPHLPTPAPAALFGFAPYRIGRLRPTTIRNPHRREAADRDGDEGDRRRAGEALEMLRKSVAHVRHAVPGHQGEERIDPMTVRAGQELSQGV